jgi:hypothetical protein
MLSCGGMPQAPATSRLGIQEAGRWLFVAASAPAAWEEHSPDASCSAWLGSLDAPPLRHPAARPRRSIPSARMSPGLRRARRARNSRAVRHSRRRGLGSQPRMPAIRPRPLLAIQLQPRGMGWGSSPWMRRWRMSRRMPCTAWPRAAPGPTASAFIRIGQGATARGEPVRSGRLPWTARRVKGRLRPIRPAHIPRPPGYTRPASHRRPICADDVLSGFRGSHRWPWLHAGRTAPPPPIGANRNLCSALGCSRHNPAQGVEPAQQSRPFVLSRVDNTNSEFV